MTLAAPEHQEMSGQVEVTRRTSRTIAQFLMIHARVLEAYIHFAFIYMTYHIFLVIPIKDMINKDGDPTMPHKLATGTKPSVSYLRVFFVRCVVRKATAHVDKKALIMCHQAQKGFRGIFVGILQHQKGYLLYAPITSEIISPYDVVFDESFSSALAYTSQTYSEAMVIHPDVMYTPCGTSLKE